MGSLPSASPGNCLKANTIKHAAKTQTLSLSLRCNYKGQLSPVRVLNLRGEKNLVFKKRNQNYPSTPISICLHQPRELCGTNAAGFIRLQHACSPRRRACFDYYSSGITVKTDHCFMWPLVVGSCITCAVCICASLWKFCLPEQIVN